MLDAVRKKIGTRLPQVKMDRLRADFLAWWNGQTRPELPQAVEHEQSDSGTSSAGTAIKQAPAREPTNEEIFKLKMLVAETLWGEGFLGPGNSEFVIELASQFGLTKEHSLCFLGSGLAGAARAITKETGAWVSAYEMNPGVIKKAREQCAIAGLAKRVVVSEFDPVKTEIPEHKFQVAMSFDQLFLVEDKKGLLERVTKSLVPDGSLIFTDYVVPRQPVPGRAETWFDAYWGMPHLATAQNYIEILQALGLDIRVKKDITGEYVGMINAAMPEWNGLIELAREPEVNGVSRTFFARQLADEANIWAARLEALAKGELQVHRFLAIKT